jgi:hypothetical protein
MTGNVDARPQNIRRENHFVPAGLMRPWLWQDDQLRAYWWDRRRAVLRCKQLGVRAFCFQRDLLTTRNREGLTDQLERDFESIDTAGMVARDKLMKDRPNSLSVEQRRDFARLLMSLEVRRPRNVDYGRNAGQVLRRTIDADPEIIEAFHKQGIQESPSSWWDRESPNGFLHEQSFASIMRQLTDHPVTEQRLINATWKVLELGPNDGTFVLSDRPLIRSNGFLAYGAGWFWALALTPKNLFVATDGQKSMSEFLSLSRRRLGKLANTSSVRQAERFVFVLDSSHAHWLGKCLSNGALPAASVGQLGSRPISVEPI